MDDQDEQDDHDFVEYDDGSGVSAFRNQGRRGVGILSSLSPSPSPSPRRSRRRSGSWERNEENQKQSSTSTSRSNRPIPRNNEDDDEDDDEDEDRDGNGEFDDDDDDDGRPDGHPMRRAVTSDGEGFVCMVCEDLWEADDVAHFEQRPARRRRLQQQRQLQQEHRALGTVL